MYPLLYDISKWLLARLVDVCFPGLHGGLEHIPRHGAFIVASNHASFIDPAIVGCRIPARLVFFARKTLWKPGFASWWLDGVGTVPVDRDAGNDVSALKRVLASLKEGRPVILFPEGTRTPDGNLQTAKAGVGMIACRTQVPVLPVRIFGSYEAYGRHRSIPRICMPVHVCFGPPLLPADYDPGPKALDRYQTAADRILAAIAAIPPPGDQVI